ncbi:MAG: hypothetical protein SCALA702_05340 [Melioribacteraceae bacterium]|nr:MAG: hypothetical protein SCALA702_05340 [Melioribacteraceae bacterium]
MRILLSFLLLVLFSTLIVPQNYSKKISLRKIDNHVIIDGEIDNVWALADSVTDFTQHQPYWSEKPSLKTVAKVLTSDESLYCLIKCYDDRGVTEYQTGILDDFGGDIVSFMIDTFNDKRTAYKFAVASSGFRSDARLLDDARNRDYSWDGIWFAETKRYNWGFAVEIEIPYKSIQYNESAEHWGIDFDRWIPNLTEDIYWCAYEENEGQRISKFGQMVFENFYPVESGLNLEIFPVAIGKMSYLGDNKYKVEPDAGIDFFYNPSPRLTLQATANPDFAQIEADPYDFNISRYESYFSERRPFFTQGNEIFMPAGRQRNTGFYRPLELFYSRRIGKKLPDGSEVPLVFGAKAFGRFGDTEYGSFIAGTGSQDFKDGDAQLTEESAYFASARVKKQIFDNSSVGVLYVGKFDQNNDYGVLDIDGAFRGSNWQLAYQLARSFKNNEGDYAFSAGLTSVSDGWITYVKTRLIGADFDIDQIGFVPWRGNSQVVTLSGPRWYFDTGYIRQILMYAGGIVNYEDADLYTDLGGLFGFNMQFRDNWGFEINLDLSDAKDSDINYSSFSANFSSWFNPSAKFSGNLWGGYQKTYNFSRDYLSFYSWAGTSVSSPISTYLEIGTSVDVYIEGDPDYNVEEVIYNARPYFSLTPVNNLNIKMYVDNVYVSSSDKLERLIVGFFFAYNFSPKSWIYLAFNEFRDRSEEYDANNNILPAKLHVTDRAAVLKVKYLYYF